MKTLWNVRGTALVLQDDGKLLQMPEWMGWNNRDGTVYLAGDDSILERFGALVAPNGLEYLMQRSGDLWLPLHAGLKAIGAGVNTKVSEDDRVGESSAFAEAYRLIYQGGVDPENRKAPELFFKADHDVMTGPGGLIGRRRGARTVKPEPEFVVVFKRSRTTGIEIVGWTLGNDQTVNHGGTHEGNHVPGEGENPLYLPQCKTFQHCFGVGPCLLLHTGELDPNKRIHLRIERLGKELHKAAFPYKRYLRNATALLPWVERVWGSFLPHGGALTLGTGMNVPDEAAVVAGDVITISCDLFPMPLVQTVVDVP